MSDPAPLPRLARALHLLPPSCGPVRLVAVDGHAGSGKTTFAAHLAAALGGAPVVALDSVASHEELFSWTGRLRSQVIEPLRRGEHAHCPAYDWRRRTFGPPVTIPPAPVVLLEGVGSGRRALRPWLASLLWMDADGADAWRRGRLRDGPEQAAFWDRWTAAERRHFADDPSRPFADRLVRRHPGDAARQDIGHDGYAILPGPAGTAGTIHPLTDRDGQPPMR